MEKLKISAVAALVGVFILLVLADFYDSAFLGNRYDVPSELFTVIGAVMGTLLADKVVSGLRK